MAGNVKELTDANFAESTKSGVALIDFWAPWCPPCRAQGPVIEKISETFSGKATVAKLNVDENGEVAGQFSVTSIPTLILFKDGKEINRLVGLRQESELVSTLNNALQ